MGEDLKPAMPGAFSFSLSAGISPDPPVPVFSHQLVVGKAPLNSPPAKQASASQQALATFLAKKREKYKSRLNCNSLDSRLECCGVQRSKRVSPQNHHIQVSSSAPLGLNSNASLDHLHESKHILRIASLDSQALYSHSNKLEYGRRAQGIPQNDQDRGLNTLNTSNDFVKLGSEELADRVVSGARLRRRNKKKHNSTVLREVLRPLIKLHQERPTAPPPLATSTPIPPGSPSSSTPSKSPLKRERRTSYSALIKGEEPTGSARSKSLGLSKSLDELQSLYSKQMMPAKRVIFQSEKQSATLKDTGIPSVPPPTPRAESAPDVKIVPSMSDIKSQRDLKSRLHLITAKSQESQECLEKQQQLKIEKEKREKKAALNRLKMQQRAEIYALNKVMAEFERQKFESFMSGKV